MVEIVLVEQWGTPEALFHAVAAVELSAPRLTACGRPVAATAPEMRRELAESRASACPDCYTRDA
jgi:hypothetical protein